MSEEDILYQNGYFWVCKDKRGCYEVYRDTITHAERAAIIGYKGEEGLERAKSTCDKLASGQ